MTITADTPKSLYTGDGADTTFAVGFEFHSTSDIEVVTRPTGDGQADTIGVLDTDYTLAGTPTGGVPFTNGTVTFTVAPAADAKITIRLKPTQTQPDAFADNVALSAVTLGIRLDLLTQMVIELQEEVDRAPKFPLTDLGSTSLMAENASDRASKYAAYDGSGNPTVGVALTAQTVEYFSQVFSGDGANKVFTLSAAPASAAATEVHLLGVRKVPTTDYTVSGTTLTFVVAPPNTANNVLVVWSQAFAGSVADGAVTTAKLAALAVTGAKIGADAITAAKIADNAVEWDDHVKGQTAGDTPHWDASGDPARLAKGTALQVYRMNAGATVPEWAEGGRTVKVVNVMDGEVATGTTVMVEDDTIPQKTEGDEYMTLAITPKSATNKLRIDVVLHMAHTAGGAAIVGLFQDTTADALAVGDDRIDGAQVNQQIQILLTHYMTAGTTSATTFKVRAGTSAAGTTTFNGLSGARKYGGVLASSITITEIIP
jgi:hypothetical protein